MLRRMYHVSAVSYNVKKLGTKLCKMINPKNKKAWHPSFSNTLNSMPTVKSLVRSKNEPGGKGVRRMAMLNKIFMKQITDLMSTGTNSMNIVGHGIVISKVKISSDYHTVNVYWVSKGTYTDNETAETLSRIAGPLRHELSSMRIMGEIPYIVFVKDEQESRLRKISDQLTLADFGEDYKPTELGHLLKSEFCLDTKLSPEMKAKIKQIEEETLFTEELLPEMTHVVYGLDHAKILQRLQAAVKKNKEAWDGIHRNSDVISYRRNDDMSPAINHDQQKDELAEFLLKRKVSKEKSLKEKFKCEDDYKKIMEQNEDERLDDTDDYVEDDYLSDDDIHQDSNYYK